MRGAFCLAVLFSVPFSLGVSQSTSVAPRTTTGFPALPEDANPHPDGVRFLRDSLNMADNQKLLAALNVQRQKDMTQYTAQLLTLANELKAETEKGRPDSLSVVDMRKAEQIEKLAHAVHEKMKATIGN